VILALKTASATTHISFFKDAQAKTPESQLEWESGRELSSQLLARLGEFLGSSKLGLKDLTGIVIFSGPGSFTSLRIGHSVANALADSLGIPIVGAAGEDWISAGKTALQGAAAGHPALPAYGAEAHITKPKS
jgi:tRNA threonylcarbamoyladenosine biosynthesis protein TsaB